MKKLSLLLALLLGILPTYALAENEAPTELRVMVPLIVTDVKADGWAVKKLEELTNTKLNYEIVSFSDYDAKVNVMAAANTLPDILQIFNIVLENKLIEDGLLWPIDDLLAEYGPNILGARSSPPNLWEYYTHPKDGRIYSYPSVDLYMDQGHYIRQDWLDDMRMTAPTNLEEYYTLAKAFALNDPDGNGENDTYGLLAIGTNTTYFRFFEQSFGAFNGFIQVAGDGTMTYGQLLPEYAQVLKEINRFYQEGLIDPEFLLNKDREIEVQQAGDYGMIHMNLQRVEPQNVILQGIRKTQPNAHFSVYNAPLSPDGTRKSLLGDIRCWISTTVTKTCKQPEKAVQFLDALMSEEINNIIRFGEEGKMYDLIDGKVVFKDEWVNADHRWMEGLDEQVIFPCYRELFDPKAWGDEVIKGVKFNDENIFQQPIYPANNEILNQYRTTLSELFDTYFVEIVTTPGADVEAMHAQFVDEYMRAGGDKVIAELNRIHQESLK